MLITLVQRINNIQLHRVEIYDCIHSNLQSCADSKNVYKRDHNLRNCENYFFLN